MLEIRNSGSFFTRGTMKEATVVNRSSRAPAKAGGTVGGVAEGGVDGGDDGGAARQKQQVHERLPLRSATAECPHACSRHGISIEYRHVQQLYFYSRTTTTARTGRRHGRPQSCHARKGVVKCSLALVRQDLRISALRPSPSPHPAPNQPAAGARALPRLRSPGPASPLHPLLRAPSHSSQRRCDVALGEPA